MILSLIDNIDKKLSAKIHHADYGIFNHVIFFFAVLFNSPVTIIIPLMYIYWKSDFSVNSLAHFGALQLLGLFFTLALKKSLARPRPILHENAKKSRALRKKETNHSMPSGDSLQAGIFASFCFLNYGEIYWFLIMIIVMYGRVHFVCHYLMDTIVGASIAIALAFSVNDIVLNVVNDVLYTLQ